MHPHPSVQQQPPSSTIVNSNQETSQLPQKHLEAPQLKYGIGASDPNAVEDYSQARGRLYQTLYIALEQALSEEETRVRD